VAAVTGQQVADFLGHGDDVALVAMAEQHVQIVTAMAQAYTRGQGFEAGEPADDIAAVVTTATARLVSFPDQSVSQTDTAGTFSMTRSGAGFRTWTLPELFVLNRYRKRAR